MPNYGDTWSRLYKASVLKRWRRWGHLSGPKKCPRVTASLPGGLSGMPRIFPDWGPLDSAMDSLPRGKAVRVGSVAAKIAIPVTLRPYTDHHAYCFHYSQGTCRKCLQRCPAGAISPTGHDKADILHTKIVNVRNFLVSKIRSPSFM